MKDYPKISIVMPSYNHASYLEKSITSVLNQGYPNKEILIIDGGSTDGSQNIIQRYSNQIDYWQSKPDNGQADALCQGFLKATGILLGWLNSDDVLLPGSLERASSAFQNHPEMGIFAGNILWIDQDDGIIRFKRIPASAGTFAMHGVYAIAQPGSFFTKAAYDAVGGINPKLRYVMDADLFIRMMANGTQYFPINAWQAAFRFHKTSKTVAESTLFSEEFERTRAQEWRSVKPGKIWKLLYKLWQSINGNYVRMGIETVLARGETWQTRLKE